MHVVFTIATVIVAILLIGIVLIQKSKGGGLSSQFGGVNSVLGVRQTNSGLEKLTWWLIGILVVFSIASALTMPKVSTSTELRTLPSAAPAPVAAPAGQFDTPVAAEAVEAVEVEVPAEAAEAPAANE